jgi:hypothetical protein
MTNTKTDTLHTADLLKAAYLLNRGCRLIGAQTMDKTTYMRFEDHDRCKSFLFDIANGAVVEMDELMRNFQRVKTALREAREAANAR